MSGRIAESKHIAYLVPGLEHVSVRYRVDPFIPALEARGWTVRKWVIPNGFLQRLKLFRRLRGADVVVLVRKLFHRWQLGMLRWYARSLLYDVDDAVLYRDSSRKNRFSRVRTGRFRSTVRGCRRVIAGNQYLAGLAESFGGRAFVVPTCVDDEALCPSEDDRRGGRLVIGWIGSRSTLMYLEGLRGVFEEIGRRYGESVLLKVVCDDFPESMGLPVERKVWDAREESADLRSFDIGLMPLTDDPWTRGKCGFKLLQYMAVGVPAVASPVGVNVEIIRDGENGFIAGEPGEWVDVLSTLIEDLELRRRIGRAGRESLKGRYVVGDWIESYVKLIEEVAGLPDRENAP